MVRFRLMLLAASVFLFGQLLAACAGVSQQPGLTLVTSFGGEINAIAAQNGRLYVGIGPNLEVVDVKNPASPVMTGTSRSLGNPVEDVAVTSDDKYAMVALGTGGLAVLDVSKPGNITIVGRYVESGVNVQAVALDGLAGFLAVEAADSQQKLDGVIEVDLGEIANAKPGSGLISLNAIHRVVVPEPCPALLAVSQTHIALSAYDECDEPEGTTWIIDRQTFKMQPEIPADFGRIEKLTFRNNDLSIMTDMGLRIVTFTGAERQVKNVVGLRNENGVGAAQDMALVSDTIAAIARTDIGIQLIDVSTTKVVSSIPSQDPRRMVVSGKLLFVVEAEQQVVIFDLSDTAAPHEVSRYAEHTGGLIDDVVVRGNYLYVGYVDRLEVFSVKDPAVPTYVGTYSLPGLVRTKISVSDDGKQAILYGATNQGVDEWLIVLDTSSPAQVHEVNRIAISDKGFNASSPAVRNNHLAGAVSSKSTWKAAVITNGQLTQQVEIKDMAISMKFASESRLIQNVFITNTTVPVTDTKVISGQVQLVPGFVYSSTFELRLQDMSGQQPQLLDKVSATGSSSGYNMLWADKNSLYVIPPNNEKGQTIDVYDISSDKLVRRSTIPIGDAQTVVATAQDTRFFFDTRADRGSVVMVDLSDPANPKRFPEVQLAGHYIAALSAGGGYLYVATDNAGLNVLAVK